MPVSDVTACWFCGGLATDRYSRELDANYHSACVSLCAWNGRWVDFSTYHPDVAGVMAAIDELDARVCAEEMHRAG